MSTFKNNAWRYYEGTTSANSVVKDLAKVITTGVRTKKLDLSENTSAGEVIINKNWDIQYPKVDKLADDMIDVMDWENLTPEEYLNKINHQVSRIGDTVILKTKTTPVNISGNSTDDIGLENDLGVSSIDMYLEIYKPKYISDPEKFDPECERHGILPYLVTRDIYEEFAKGETLNEINIKDLHKTNQYVTLTNVVDKGSNSRNSNYDEIRGFLTELKKYGLFVEMGGSGYDETWSFNVEIPNDVFELMRSGTSALSSFVRSNYNPKSKDRQYKVKIRAAKIRSTVTFPYSVGIEWERDIETYRVLAKFELTLQDAADINWSTFNIAYDGDTSGQDIMGHFTVDKVKGVVTCVKTIDATTELVGDPIISYKSASKTVTISGKKLVENNHYVYFRLFDKLNVNGDGPLLYDANSRTSGNADAKLSEWSKLSWYQDFAETSIDELDADVGGMNMADGVVFLPIVTPGLTGETRMRFWINTNNDRFSLVMMGNPSLDFSSNRHLISSSYVGKIDSFEGGINDTAGNFALYTSSSTAPCTSKTVSEFVYSDENYIIGLGDGVSTRFAYKMLKDFNYNSSSQATVTISGNDGTEVTVREGEGFAILVSPDKKSIEVTMFSAPVTGATLTLNCSVYKVKSKSENGVIRDSLGNVIHTKYPDKYGVNTATGVIDVGMLHTRSKAYFQKHHFMFTTTEEYMSKEGYGKSAYTNEYYADKLKITHGNDGPRGTLADMLAIDTSSLYPFDELIVNRDFKKDYKDQEETYVFFPVTAPYSPFAGSPNGTFGVAIKKDYRLPELISDEEAIEQGLAELDLYVGNLHNLVDDIYLPDSIGKDVAIEWSSSNSTAISFEPAKESKSKTKK